MYKKNQPYKLHQTTLALLRNRPYRLKYKEISEATGLPESWIKAFASEKIPDPSVNRIEMLYSYLSDKTLDV